MSFLQTGFVDLSDSVQGAGVVTAPGAGGVVVATITPGAGTWLVQASCGTGAGAPVAADVGNMKLQKTGADVVKLANPIGGVALMPPVRVTLAAADTLGIVAVGAATAGVVYVATLTAVKVA